MSREILRPNASLGVSGTGYSAATVVGAGDLDVVLSEDTDTSYVEMTSGEGFLVAFEDYSVPAGAEVLGIALRIRSSVLTGSAGVRSDLRNVAAVERRISQSINWATIATTYLNPYTDGVVFDPDNIQMLFGVLSGGATLRVYRAYADVFYVEQPNLTIDSPTGTIDRNLVEISWTPDLDATGGEQFSYSVAIMADGEHPDTDPPIYESGAFGDATSITLAERLPEDTYEAYVKISQLVNGEAHWSDWVGEGFTISVDEPGTPTIAVTPQASAAQVKIELHDTAGDTTTLAYNIQRWDGDEWVDVRTVTDGHVGTDHILYDTEAPNGETLDYRTRAVGADFVVSDWVYETTSYSSSQWWLKHPFDPSMNVALNMRSYPGSTANVRTALHWVLGRSDPVAVTETVGLPAGDLQVRCDTYAERQALTALINSGVPLLLSGPVAERDDDRWIVFTGAARERIIDKAWVPETWETLPWQEVARPDGDLTVAAVDADDTAEDLLVL